MKLIISGSPEEIAAIAAAIQDQRIITHDIKLSKQELINAIMKGVNGSEAGKPKNSATRDHHEDPPEEEPIVALESVPTVALFEELQSRKETISFEAGPYMQYDIKPKYGIPYSPMVLEPLYAIAMRQEDF